MTEKPFGSYVMIAKIFFHLKTGFFLFLLAGIFSGCAETTEPAVRAYLHEKKAYSEIQVGHLQIASSELKKALKDNPEEPSILNNMAFIAFKSGHYKKAVGFLEQARALKAGANDEVYILNEARIFMTHHEYKRGLSLLSLIEPRQKWPNGYRKIMAEALLHNGESSHALAILLKKHDLSNNISQQ